MTSAPTTLPSISHSHGLFTAGSSRRFNAYAWSLAVSSRGFPLNAGSGVKKIPFFSLNTYVAPPSSTVGIASSVRGTSFTGRAR